MYECASLPESYYSSLCMDLTLLLFDFTLNSIWLYLFPALYYSDLYMVVPLASHHIPQNSKVVPVLLYHITVVSYQLCNVML